MANNCTGFMKVVSKDPKVFARLVRILDSEDSIYVLRGSDGCTAMSPVTGRGGLYAALFSLCGRWSCEQFVTQKDAPDDKVVVEYSYDGATGETSCRYGTAHYTGLPFLAKKLGFGCEAWTCEEGCGFCEHWRIDHTGFMSVFETGNYSCKMLEGGKIIEWSDLKGFNKMSDRRKIYGRGKKGGKNGKQEQD